MYNSTTVILGNRDDFNISNSFSWMNMGQRNRGISLGVIGSVALLSNLSLCVVLVQNRQMLQRAYNVIIFVLGVVDLLTGVAGLSVAIRIAVLPEKASCAPNLRETLLRIAWCGWLEFVLGKISILLITCLALERWFAVVKPIQYRYNFSKKRLYLYLILILLTASLSKLQELLPNYDPQTLTSRVFVITEVALTCLLPLFITWFTYAHIWYHSRKSPAIQRTGGGKGKEKLLRMCAITALFITISWVPSDINYVIINVINNRETLSIFSAFDMIAMSNSMINPWVYYFTNREYKNEFKKLFNNLLAIFRNR